MAHEEKALGPKTREDKNRPKFSGLHRKGLLDLNKRISEGKKNKSRNKSIFEDWSALSISSFSGRDLGADKIWELGKIGTGHFSFQFLHPLNSAGQGRSTGQPTRIARNHKIKGGPCGRLSLWSPRAVKNLEKTTRKSYMLLSEDPFSLKKLRNLCKMASAVAQKKFLFQCRFIPIF